MKKITTLAFVLASFSVASIAQAEGRSVEDIAKTCAACHGADGNAVIPTYPSLAGQYANYMVKALQDYKAGKRTGGQAPVMTGQAAGLSDAEMEAIAKYYARMDGKLMTMPAK